MKKQSSTTKKPVLENYTKSKKIKPGKYITVLDKKGGIKLLNTGMLLRGASPVAVSFAGFGRELMETFNTQYGFGYAEKPGRFVFDNSKALLSDYLGWHLVAGSGSDQNLDLRLFMGPFGGVNPFPAIRFSILEVNLVSNFEAAILTVIINEEEVVYEVGPVGDVKLLFVIHKPADLNFIPLQFKLWRADNPLSNGIIISSINRYTSILAPVDVNEVLEISEGV